jgi:para-nitrobenzyl esterase
MNARHTMDSVVDFSFCTAETTNGKVRGLINSAIRQFKGVPYGASTAGANRFKRPERPTPWSGVRDCFGYGPASPQLPSDLGNDYARLVHFDLNVALGGTSEDCLGLNIWTPGTGTSEKRAVLFSIHGGGFALGSGNNPLYDGARLAYFGDVVVVTVTHRLASFGYLNLAAMDSSGEWADSGACGILDLVAALEWVRDNIGNFGGDPQRVMIFGQSGGGWKVSALLAMNAARGLFHRAVIQSGSLLKHLSWDESARVSDAFCKKLGLAKSRLKDISSIPWRTLLAAQTEIGAHAFAPVLDGVNFAADPFSPAAPPQSADVPLIVSTALDDAGLFFDNFGLTETELAALLRQRYGIQADRLLGLYREQFPRKSPYLLQTQMITDASFRRFANWQAERKADQARAAVYAYLWQWSSPAFDGKFGAAHAMDVAASFFNDREAILGAGSKDAHAMCSALASVWVNFAKTGDPNNANVPNWPKYDAKRRPTMIFGPDTQVANDPYAEIRAFWANMPEPDSVLG